MGYTVSDGHIVIRVPEYSEIYWYAPGAEVTFNVDGDQTHPGAVQLRRTATCCGCHQSRSNQDPAAERWPEGIHTSVLCLPLAGFGGTCGHLDLAAFNRAIDTSDAESQIAVYDDSAEVQVIDADNPPSAPRVLKGKDAIADWVRSNCQPQVSRRVVRLINGADRIAYTVAQVQDDGSPEIVATSTAELRDGLVTHEHTILFWDLRD